MVRELERAARSMGDDLRARAGKAGVPPDLENALRTVLQGLTNITAQIEKAVGELRRYLEANASASGTRGGRSKGSKRKAAPARKKAPAGNKKASKKKPAARKAAKKSAARPSA